MYNILFFSQYDSAVKLDSAPLRSISVRDAMSDLPNIKNGSCQREMSYNGEPHCHFQRLVCTYCTVY